MFYSYFLFNQTSAQTAEVGAIQKAADFLRAFMLGFDVKVGILICVYFLQ